MDLWPLVGREDELARIAATLERPSAGSLVVAGAAGVGKTRLVQDTLNRIGARGGTAHWVVATQAAASIPFGPVAHLLPPATEEATASRLDLLRAVAERLVAERSAGRLILGIDDAHLLDDASAALIHHLALTETIPVVATVRSGMPAPDAVTALWKDGLAEWLEVQPLSRDALGELLGAAVAGQVDGATLHELWRLSRGNALFVRELVIGALEAGTLAEDGGVWRARGPLATGTRLTEVVQARLGRLPDEVRAVAEVLAVGEPLEDDLLEAAVPGPALRAAESAGLIEALPDRQRAKVRLAHPLYTELIRATTAPLRARAIRRDLADLLAATPCRRGADVLRLASWRMEAGGRPEPHLLVRAAHRANRAFFDHALAERLAEAAVRAGGGLGARRAQAEAVAAAGRAADAEQLLAGIDLDEAADDDRTKVTLVRANNLFWGLGRMADAEAVAHEGETAVTTPGWRDELVVLRASIAFARGHAADALDVVTGVLARDPEHEGTALRALALAVAGWGFTGRADHATRVAEATLARVRAGGEERPVVSDRLLPILCLTFRFAGRLQEAEALATRGYHDALERRAAELQATWALQLGETALARGNVAAALQWLREGAARLRERAAVFGVYSRAWCLGSLAEACALAGELDTARTMLAEADAAAPAELFIPNRERGRGWLLAAGGELSQARAVAMDAARTAAANGAAFVEAVALHDAARLGVAGQVAGRLAELATTVEGRFPPLYVAHAAALAAGDGQALDRCATAFADIGMAMHAAEAAAEAAAAHRRSGRAASALSSAARSSSLLARTPALRTPALTLDTPGAQLTAREREVALLAARGLASKEIAARLVVSARTVDNHLHNAYAKLGVSSRTELARVLGVG